MCNSTCMSCLDLILNFQSSINKREHTILPEVVKYRHNALIANRIEGVPAHLERAIEILAIIQVARDILEEKRASLQSRGRSQSGQQIRIAVHVEVTASQGYTVRIALATLVRKAPLNVGSVLEIHVYIVPARHFRMNHDLAIFAILV